jgi:hypothetical protein
MYSDEMTADMLTKALAKDLSTHHDETISGRKKSRTAIVQSKSEEEMKRRKH